MAATIPAPDPTTLLSPILPALPPATVAKEPAPGVLPLLSPILRQRVQLLSASSTEPWLRLLSYDPAKAAKLVEVAQSGAFEPHPISGEVEVDWDYDAETRYRRLDEETLQALIAVEMLGLVFQLIYCVGDTAGGGDGWRIGEVTVPDRPDAFVNFKGVASIAEAETNFKEQSSTSKQPQTNGLSTANATLSPSKVEDDDEDDDGYWDRYDATPAGRTPAQKRSPAPRSLAVTQQQQQPPASQDAADEDNYFAQYDDVQPAMDNHDPDEEAEMEAHAIAPIGTNTTSITANDTNETHGSWTLADANDTGSSPHDASLLHPRPASSNASSDGEQRVAKLEEMASKSGENEFSIKQHVSRSVRSLWLLSRGSGIDREEFERMVRTELDLLGMVEDLS